MAKVGDAVTAQRDGKPVNILVTEVVKIPFGTTLPEGFMDATTEEDERLGFRYGVKGVVK